MKGGLIYDGLNYDENAIYAKLKNKFFLSKENRIRLKELDAKHKEAKRENEIAALELWLLLTGHIENVKH